jgi:hypothetical protein
MLKKPKLRDENQTLQKKKSLEIQNIFKKLERKVYNLSNLQEAWKMWTKELEENGWVWQVFGIAFTLKPRRISFEDAKPNMGTSGDVSPMQNTSKNQDWGPDSILHQLVQN